MKNYKVFGIGLSKTGTNSLTEALQILGYNTKHYPNPAQMLNRNFNELLKTYDALTDSPVVAVYKDIDTYVQDYLALDGKFIYTFRDEDSWITSAEAHWERMGPRNMNSYVGQVRMELFGTVEFNEKIFRDKNKKHLEDVKKYFKDRPDDLLVMNICEGDSWEVLCPFLDKSIPNIPFPKLNITERLT
tara:strand:- start:76 stop:639 length:564 start_codon:yes stop_codon:yes gene_type:complete